MKLLPGKVPQVFFMLLFACASFTSFAQTRVSGKVIDSKDNHPLSNVSVKVKSSGKTVQTSADGSFHVDAPSASSVLIFTSVGYAPQEAAAKDGAFSISLVQTNTQLQDVVVVAYGTRKKSDLTGAVVSVGQKDFQKGQITSAEQLLQGKVAGLSVTTGGGSAGGGSSLKIRGISSINLSSEPLIVIDGVPVDNNNAAGSPNILGTINPNDIESITVLKDATSTALYGSRAAKGVIIITTKKGGAGKTLFNFNTRLSVSSVQDFTKVLDADQVRSIINANYSPTGTNYRSQLTNNNTDWQRVIFQDAPAVDNNLSASGTAKFGGVRLPFRISAGYLTQTGVLTTNKFDRSTAAINLSPKLLNNDLSVNLAVKYAHTHTRFADEGAIGSALAFDPTKPVLQPYSKNGGYYEYLQADGTPNPLAPRNPLALLKQRNNIGNFDRITGNLQLDYKLPFFPDLHLQGNFGLDNTYGTGYDTRDATSATALYPKNGPYQAYKQKKQNTLIEAFLFYNKELKKMKSKVDILAGHTYEAFPVTGYAFPTYYAGIIDSSTIPVNKSGIDEYRMESYLTRLNFSYHDKYLLTASGRRDATSRFSTENRIGYFYGVALAWKIKGENFLKNASVISDLKLRVGYGETGNQDGIYNYAFVHDYFQSSNTAQYQFGSTYYYFYRPAAFNANLKWETTDNTNIGLDFGLFKNRLSGSVDAYEKKSKDLLTTIPIAPGTNFSNVLLYNIGNLTNRGIEVALNTTPVKTKNFSWDLNVNGSYNKARITNLLLIQDPNYKGIPIGGISGGTGNTIARDLVGYSPNYFYVMKQVYGANGKPIEGLYEDLNRDGVVNSDDSYMAKPSQPDFVFGFSTQLNYRKFSIGAAGHGTAGNYMYNNIYSNTGTLNSLQNPLSYISNASVNYLQTGFKTKQYFSDYYLQNASFLKIDNINIGYNYGRLNKNSKATLRLSAGAQNIATITKYPGTDPEIGNGIDNAIYPRPRTFYVGANIDF